MALEHSTLRHSAAIHRQAAPAPSTARLRIRALGELRLDRDGEPLSITTRSQRAGPARLLEALIAAGGGPVAESRLHDWLWPDLEGDRAHRAFLTTLHRLRRALGVPEALEYSCEALSLVADHVELDVWAFDDACRGGRQAPEQRVAGALELYSGALLAGHESIWCAPLRERLRDRLVSIVLGAGERHERCGNHRVALALYQRALEREPAIEPLFAAVMRCQLALGSPAEALRAFRRCDATLRVHYGVGPGRHTLALARRAGIAPAHDRAAAAAA